MGKKARGKHRLDKFYHLAKEQGYRSRASFKLIQLNRRYGFLQNCRSVIDLCAAPGGWLQVAAKHMPVNSLCIGVDLDPIRPIRGCQTFVGDITTQTCRQTLKKMLNGEKCDCVLHDGAPNVGGAWSSEAATQSLLVLESLKLASEFLVPKGTFVTKIFRSKDYNALLYAFKQLFSKVEAHKPAASRNTSAEIFVVCMGYKAPSKIDPRLLDPKYIFSEVEDATTPAGPDALIKEKHKQRRHRDGYEEGVSNLRKETSAVDFLMSDKPVEMLGQYHRLHLTGKQALPVGDGSGDSDEAGGAEEGAWRASFVASHAATGQEVQALVEDLQVLGRKEYKQLLRWRLTVRKDLLAEIGKRKGPEEENDEDEGGMEKGDAEGEAADPEQSILAEMEAIKERIDRHQKRLKKRRLKMKRKARERAAVGGGAVDDPYDEAGDLFSLRSVRGKGAAQTMEPASAPDDVDLEAMERDSDDSDDSDTGSESSIDIEEEQRRFDALMDEYLEDSFQQYQDRRGQTKAASRKKRRRVDDDEAGELGEGQADDVELPDNRFDSSDEEDNQLMVDLKEKEEPANQSVLTKQWFDQDIFQSFDMEEEEENGGAQRDVSKAPKPTKKAKKAVTKAPEEEKGPAASAPAAGGTQLKGKGEEEEEFEIVPQRQQSDSGSDDDDDELDYLSDDAKAEILAIAKKMLRRKAKDGIVEAAYNRYAFHDDRLPHWFEADEVQHMRPAPILTKDELEAEKQRLQAIDARPIKKIVEAKARKRKRMAVRLDKARSKATVIAGQDDLPSSAKLREIEKLYAQAKNNGYKQKAGKAKGGSRREREQRGKSGPAKDSRLRADQARGKKAAKLKKKAGGGKGRGRK
mmetsp:Transcript_24312/g.67595  ORF Transcript_24312/g.67595 Transcript_24312/m.67595 type:complete len:859 (-) Transcript_24312:91-2667(-)